MQMQDDTKTQNWLQVFWNEIIQSVLYVFFIRYMKDLIDKYKN